MTTPSFVDRHITTWKSFRSLPVWVQVWVAGILVPVNAAAFWFMDTPAGWWAALAAALVLVSNYPVMLACEGMSRLMSLPHLIIWGPLQVFLLHRLITASPGNPEFGLILALLAVNGISLVFDAIDSWRWFAGERDVPGHA
ncbi:MAG: putative permease YjgP/YjgQ family [Marinobacter excellens HL-55]|uniref:Putative permease YjgP/YjgQ family n=1 Tax=Marinobacter excellens HL-55 TaxID=1305731 RepID=A0A0P8D484_9GAMM|nr:MAG: putative permease YjgP/YjgQ family [Marinobacter excellens HL-55]